MIVVMEPSEPTEEMDFSAFSVSCVVSKTAKRV